MWDYSLTTLDQWQVAANVVDVEVEDIIHFDPSYKSSQCHASNNIFPVLKLKIKEIMFGEKIDAEFMYTPYGVFSSLKKGDRAILSFGNFVSSDTVQPIFMGCHPLRALEEQTGEVAFYATPFNSQPWPLVKNIDGQYYLNDCLDGFTKKPLMNPLLSEIKKLSREKKDDPPTAEFVGFMFPERVSYLKACRCENKKYNSSE